MLFLHVSPLSAGPSSPIVLQIGSHAITVPRTEFQGFLRSGGGLPQLEEVFSVHGGKAAGRRGIVVLENGVFATGASSAELTDFLPPASTTAEAAAFRSQYGQAVDIFLANDAGIARENARKIRPLVIKGREDLTVYTARTVIDYDVIENLRKPLARAGIRVVGEETGYAETTSGNIIVVSGHRDRSLSDHLNHLKEANVLKGKLLAVISCYELGAESLQSALLRGPGAAAGILFYDATVNATAVESVLRELANLVGAEGFTPSKLSELLDRAVDWALERAETPFEKTEIEKLRRGLLQLSLGPSGMTPEATS